MQIIREWAAAHGYAIPDSAIADLAARLVATPEDEPSTGASTDGKSEAYVSSILRLEAAERRSDLLVMRNNVGAYKTPTGRMLRYGLLNATKEQNALIKSSDFIFVYKRLIQPQDVGTFIGQAGFVEAKKIGWSFSPADDHAGAQLTFINTMRSLGALGWFYNGAGSCFAGLPRN